MMRHLICSRDRTGRPGNGLIRDHELREFKALKAFVCADSPSPQACDFNSLRPGNVRETRPFEVTGLLLAIFDVHLSDYSDTDVSRFLLEHAQTGYHKSLLAAIEAGVRSCEPGVYSFDPALE